MASWEVWAGKDLKVHLMDRDTFQQTRVAPSLSGQEKRRKEGKSRTGGKSCHQRCCPLSRVCREQEPGGDTTVPRSPELLRLEKLSEVIKSKH